MCGAAIAGAVASSRRAERGSIVIEPGAIDLGRVRVGSQQVVNCGVHNHGAKTQEIGQVWRSCSCLDVDLAQPEIPTGQNVSLKVSFMVALSGEAEQLVILTPDGGSQAASLRIKYDAFEAVRLAPVFFNVGEFPFGTSGEKTVEFSVEDFEGEMATFASVEPTGDVHVLDAALIGTNELREGAKLKVRLASRADAPLCRFAQNFVLSTTGESPRSFVVMAHGEIVPPVRVEPQALLLGATAEDEEDESPVVTIRSSAGPIEIDRIVVSPRVALVEIASTSVDGTAATLRVRPQGDGTVSPADWDGAEIKVSLRRPSSEALRIPIYRTAAPETSASGPPGRLSDSDSPGSGSRHEP